MATQEASGTTGVATATAAASAAETNASDKPKLQKAKYAVQFGYCGAGYHGLQTNADPTHPTVEDVLMGALHKAGLVADSNMDDPFHKLGWQRASRTDKGVSALRNLASAKLLRQLDGDEAAVDRVNQFLPDAIRLYGLQPVTASFNSHLHCTGREYEYYLPTYALLPKATFQELLPTSLAPAEPSREMADEPPVPKPFASDTIVAADDADDADGEPEGGAGKNNNTNKRNRRGGDRNDRGDTKAARAEDGPAAAADASSSEKFFMFKSIPPDAAARLRAHRITPDALERARALFRMYEGTQSFHNFTPKGDPSDARMTRFMRKIRVSDPLIVRASLQTGELVGDDVANDDNVVELEFVRVELDGQSFMMNQIRKMIGTVCTILAAGLDAGDMRSCLEKSVQRGMPMAPANGLFLVDLFFDRYNYTLERIQGEGSNARDRQPIVMANVPTSRVDHVRRRVLASIVREELAHDIFGRWMRGTRFIAKLAWGMDLE
uniref:Pseudouridine synthase I TruA alpha/beta domain-containing protein n=1 Tax=Neobodo designis TaxID=312471 RepID=A0A7S1W8C8_NEODS|mmetsp:Transcript_6946/g.21754  ORF Transcript_6946/g.21754 Transcript_6946/m.21754 type:complete len:494 (+) Transcript_6946:54-1535(+)